MYKNQNILLLAVSVIYGVMISSIGFLSDDYSLLDRAQDHHLLLPLENHHYSLLVNVLFKYTVKWGSGAELFHFLAITFHILNSFLVMNFCKKSLKLSVAISFSVALLFTINMPGIEALVWCCSLPYILTASLILWSMMIYCKYLEDPNNRRISFVSAKLSLILLLGLLTWEWSVLIVPITLALALLYTSEKSNQEKLLPVLPLAIILGSVFFVRSTFGLSTGYESNSIEEMLGILVASPFVGLFPFLPKEFYTSTVGITTEIVLLVLMVWMASRDKTLRLLLVIFLISQLPTSILGHPQSRYYYFSTFPLYAFGVVVLTRLGKFRQLFSLWYLACLLLTISHIHSWQNASMIATTMKKDIQQLINTQKGPIVILDLPQSYGPDQEIWRPHLWRNGLEIFDGNLLTHQEEGGGYPVYLFQWDENRKSYELVEVKS